MAIKPDYMRAIARKDEKRGLLPASMPASARRHAGYCPQTCRLFLANMLVYYAADSGRPRATGGYRAQKWRAERSAYDSRVAGILSFFGAVAEGVHEGTIGFWSRPFGRGLGLGRHLPYVSLPGRVSIGIERRLGEGFFPAGPNPCGRVHDPRVAAPAWPMLVAKRIGPADEQIRRACVTPLTGSQERQSPVEPSR